MFTWQSKSAIVGSVSLFVVMAIPDIATAEVRVYLDQGSFEAALLTSKVVDFEGVPDGELIVRAAGYSWDGLVAGVKMYQMDKNVDGYYGAPFLSDFVASTLYSQPVNFELPPGANAIGGQWFHSQIIEYDGHFEIELADVSTSNYLYEEIASGREEGTPDFCGFICTDQDIAGIDFHNEHDGALAGSMADNVIYGYGVPGAQIYKSWNADPEFFAGAFSDYAIVADDIQVEPGAEGQEIISFTVDLMNWNQDGASLQLLVYDDDSRTGLPGTLLGTLPLTTLEYGERKIVTIPGGGLTVPADGFMWVAVQADVSGAGWFISDQNADIGSSDDHVALDEGAGFAYMDFGTDLISNMNLVVTLPEVDCPADIGGDGVVDVLDLLAILGAWGQSDVPEDINGDGTVDVLDLLEVLGAWGPCA